MRLLSWIGEKKRGRGREKEGERESRIKTSNANKANAIEYLEFPIRILDTFTQYSSYAFLRSFLSLFYSFVHPVFSKLKIRKMS